MHHSFFLARIIFVLLFSAAGLKGLIPTPTPPPDSTNDTWRATSTINARSGRQDDTGVWPGREKIVWVGQTNGPSYPNTGGRYSGPQQATPAPTPSGITVSLPIDTFNTSIPAGTAILEPVITTNINASQNLDGFQGDFLFDSAVVDFDTGSGPVQPAGMTANQWNVAGNVLNSGPGTIKTLRVLGFATGSHVLSGSGTLCELRMLRVSSTPGASSTMNWQPPPRNFDFFDSTLNTITPDQTNGLIAIVGGTGIISGSIAYCSPGPVAGVLMALTGTSGGSATTDDSGNYSFTALAAGGSYTVTPAKAALLPGSPGINTLDVIAVQKHFTGSAIIPPGCQLTAANVTPPATVNTLDVISIQHFFLGLTHGIGNTGKYQFAPANRTYQEILTNQTGQNFDTLILGDVASPFADRLGGPSPEAAGGGTR